MKASKTAQQTEDDAGDAGPGGTRSEAVAPQKICSRCSFSASLIEVSCPRCVKDYEIVNRYSEDREKNIRISHAMKKNMEGCKDVVWKLRGIGGGNVDSQTCRKHWSSARKKGFVAVIQRYIMDVWYRDSCDENGFDYQTVCRFEKEGDPEWRKQADIHLPLAKGVRKGKGMGRRYPDPATYGGADQGGSDSNYRGRGKGSTGKKHGKHRDDDHQNRPGGTRGEDRYWSSSSSSQSYWQGQWY